jgi:hypothetical protein
MARRALIQAVRLAWLLAALGFIGWFIATRWEEAWAHLSALSPWQPAAAFALLVAAKLVYVEVVRRSLKAVGAPGGWPLAFSAYNLSGLGKYIPGSVWQFVGRFEIYRSSGVGAPHAVGLILLENAIMLTMAGLAGLIAAPVFLGMALDHVSVPVIASMAAAGALATAGGVIAVPALRARLRQAAGAAGRHRGLIAAMAVLFAGMWVLMGLSAWTLIADAEASGPGLAAYVIGLFALSYVAGFAAVFAPAGVGVREAVFTIGLAGFMPVEAALVIAVGHRLIYVVTDGVLGLAAWAVHARRSAGADLV